MPLDHGPDVLAQEKFCDLHLCQHGFDCVDKSKPAHEDVRNLSGASRDTEATKSDIGDEDPARRSARNLTALVD